jgi:hypothetical protein
MRHGTIEEESGRSVMDDGKARDRDDLRQDSDMAQQAARAVYEDVVWPGCGARVLQLVHEPSWDIGFAWEIRKQEDEFAVYRSSLAPAGGLGTQLWGYSQLEVSSDRLKSYWEGVRQVAVGLSPLYTGGGGFDGTLIQLALFGDMHSSVRFIWWSEYPPKWEPLDRIAREMIDTFRKAVEIGG